MVYCVFYKNLCPSLVAKITPLCFIILTLVFRCVVHVLICIWCEMGVRVHFNPTGYPVVLHRL